MYTVEEVIKLLKKSRKVYVLDKITNKWFVVKDRNEKINDEERHKYREATVEELEPHLIDILRGEKYLFE